MNEMIERVGAALRAACLKEFGTNWNNDVAWAFARAAIEAMREPTEAMIDATRIDADNRWEIWEAMIDAALSGDQT